MPLRAAARTLAWGVLTLALAALAPCTLLLVAHSCSSGELQSHSAPIFDACPDGSELKLALFGTLDVSLFAHFPLGPFLVNLACLAACSAAGLAQLYRDRGANRMVDQQIRDLVKRFSFEGDAVTYKTSFTEPKSPPLGRVCTERYGWPGLRSAPPKTACASAARLSQRSPRQACATF